MTARKKPSAADYLSELDTEPAKPAPKSTKAKRGQGKPEAPSPAASTRKRKITLYFREENLEEARSAVLALGSEGLEPSNLSALFGDALEHELERLRKRHNGGEPFPLYKSRLPGREAAEDLSGRVLVFVGLLVLAAAVVFHALSARYEMTGPGGVLRLDRFTGEVCEQYGDGWHCDPNVKRR